MHYHQELKKLNIRTRNKARLLATATRGEALKLLNEIREKSSGSELAQIDRVLWASRTNDPVIPALFPTLPQTSENFHRLAPISLETQLQVIESHSRRHADKLGMLASEIGMLGSEIATKRFAEAGLRIKQMIADFGHSHLLLRKLTLLRVLQSGPLDEIDSVLQSAGLSKNNIVPTSLMQCYQEEQDFLVMKRSIMNLPDRGGSNRFIRDLTRIPYHPLASSAEELQQLLQSALQSSLLDALIAFKANLRMIDEPSLYPTANHFRLTIESESPSLNMIAAMYELDFDAEYQFYKHSSAWLEIKGMSDYRQFLDNFYDDPEAPYVCTDPKTMADVARWIRATDFASIVSGPLTTHSHADLHALEMAGVATRSALFNYILHVTEGFARIEEEILVELMGTTRDLAKTIHSTFASNLAKACKSPLSKLILLLLIARKSRNERDDHQLRQVVQKVTIDSFSGDLVRLLEYLSSRSDAIAKYAYEIFTEDFLAKLFQLISSTSDIVDTRARMHRWMGSLTGDRVFLDRARTLSIDHQLNKIRNELDDNRIYVDVTRFQEWIDTEILRELTATLGTVAAEDYADGSNSILAVIVERCYREFCSNKIFGIASYLGRRIRHGTFKGHLYSTVIGIERTPRYEQLLRVDAVADIWKNWKANLETTVDAIIRERLHVASANKPHGLLSPNLAQPMKQEILGACVRNLTKEDRESRVGLANHLLTEYCWRLAEVDLKIFNGYLKNQRKALVNADRLTTLKSAAPAEFWWIAGDFCREVSREIDEKLIAMQAWFQKPLNVAPRASLPLLYRAVVEEVRQTFSDISTSIDTDPAQDIELVGGAYHVLYDAFYVLVYNAAKHGKPGGRIVPNFQIDADAKTGNRYVIVNITSDVRDDQSDEEVSERLRIQPDVDVDNAHLFENRSGIAKLYQLESADRSFQIAEIACRGRQVSVGLRYAVEH